MKVKKVVLCQQYNVAYQSPKSASNGFSSFVSQPSTSNKMLNNLSESYYSYCSSGVISECSLTEKSEPLMLELIDDPKLPALKNLMKKHELTSDQQCIFSRNNNFSVSNPGDEKGDGLKLSMGTRIVQKSEVSKNKTTSDDSVNGNKISDIPIKTEPVTDEVTERLATKRHASAMDSIENNSTNSDIISYNVKEETVRGRHLTPDDVVRIIGERLFQKTRKMIMDQQNIFSFQIFELHRLIKVQKIIATSPEKFLHESNFDPSTSSIQYPPMNKLLYAKPKPDALTNPNAGKINLAEQLFPKFLIASTSSSSSTDARLAPWFFHPPIGNQWLVPIKSPSEGLVYKPYHGPCFPTGGVAFGVPINASGSNVKLEPISSAEEPAEKNALPLFPTTPSIEASKDEINDDVKPRVIKVVPHGRKLAAESATRIFWSLEEERRIRRIASCASHVS